MTKTALALAAAAALIAPGAAGAHTGHLTHKRLVAYGVTRLADDARRDASGAGLVLKTVLRRCWRTTATAGGCTLRLRVVFAGGRADCIAVYAVGLRPTGLLHYRQTDAYCAVVR